MINEEIPAAITPPEPALEASDDKRRFAPGFDVAGDLQQRLDSAFPDRGEELADMIFHVASRRPRAFPR